MIEYKVIKEIQKDPTQTQRSLAKKLDVSLGKLNYVLTGLMEKGLIKARKLKNNPGSIKWEYNLTPKGIKEKIKIARNYLMIRIKDFDELQRDIDELKRDINKK